MQQKWICWPYRMNTKFVAQRRRLYTNYQLISENKKKKLKLRSVPTVKKQTLCSMRGS